jgi:poly(A) polymerase
MRRRLRPYTESADLPSFRIEGEVTPNAERHENTGLVRHPATFSQSKLDGDACRVVQKLERAGFEAYLVGGCVRDHLLDGNPKDYDIATSARPEDVRNLFRNCRIIGRRFRLAHVLFSGGKVIEVATFRRSPQVHDDGDEAPELLIRNDNAFGEAHEDALRRDFTINALFYDLEHHQILDWHAGMADIESQSIRTIGDPSVRFREDPIRILRAIKFAGRLNLGIHPDVYDAMIVHRDELAKAAKPRVFEEILRLLRHGGSARAMWLLWETGCMGVLLPELSSFLDDDDGPDGAVARFYRRLRVLDARIKAQGVPDDIVLFALLLWEPLPEALDGTKDALKDTHDFLEPLVHKLAMPRRISDGIARILATIPKMMKGGAKKAGHQELAESALTVLEVDLETRGIDLARLGNMRETIATLPRRPPPLARARRGGGGTRHP